MANHFAETSRESIENFWRALRHCDENPSCRVVPGVAENNFYPAVQPMRDLNGGEELTINFRNVPRATLDGFPWIAAIIADKVAAYDNAKMAALGPLMEANEHLYNANKKLSAENATLEVKLARTKSTINAMVSKIAAQSGTTVGSNGPLTQRLSKAIRMLETQSSNEDAGSSATSPADSINVEVMMLTEQLEKLNSSNERLITELLDLKNQLADLRNRKNESVQQKKH